MARLFMISIAYDTISLWATIINYPDSPSTFEVNFFKEFGPAEIPKIILEKKDGSFELAKSSPVINEELVIAVVKALEGHVLEKNLSF